MEKQNKNCGEIKKANKCDFVDISDEQIKDVTDINCELDFEYFLSKDSDIFLPKERAISPTYPDLALDLQRGMARALKNIDTEGFFEESMSMMNLVEPVGMSKLLDEDELIEENDKQDKFRRHVRLGLLALDKNYDDFQLNYITEFFREGLKIIKFHKK